MSQKKYGCISIQNHHFLPSLYFASDKILQNLNLSHYNSMNELANKREKIIQELRKKNRQEIRAAIRQTITSRMNSTEHPLISDVLADFAHCNHWELCQQEQSLCMVLQSANLVELDDDQHHYLVTDLYYLIHQNIITQIPPLVFKKDESGYTATFVAMTANYTNEDELAYWVQYMNDEAKEIMFLSISAQDQHHVKWIQNKRLLAFLLENAKYMESAAMVWKEMLMFSQYITKKDIDQSLGFIESGIMKQLTKEGFWLIRVLTEIWVTLIKIYCKLQFHNDKVKDMIALLKKVISKDISILMGNAIMQDLNQLYELVRDDYIQQDQGCQKILQSYLGMMQVGKESAISDEQNLFANYMLRLCHNNWRAKNLTNKHFQYSNRFYQLLNNLSPHHKQNPLYSKLLSIRKVI